MQSLSVLSAAAAGPASAFGGPAFIIQIVLLVAVFYFFILRPQQKRTKAHEATINAVQKNDDVVTGGGLLGKVTKIADDYVEVEIAPGVKVKAVKSMLVSVKPRGTKPAND
jgi:preprotein translocase subunit YajC